MENCLKIEEKLGFNKIKETLTERCSTEYARQRVSDETPSTESSEIIHRLELADEMRLICMFENSFPSRGYIDGIPFLKPLLRDSSILNKENLVKLRTFLENLKEILNFFKKSKEGQYVSLKKMAEPILFFPEIQRRIELILDKFGEIKDSASPELYKIRKEIREKEGTISKRSEAILRQAQSEGIVSEEASLSLRDGKVLIPVAAGNKKKLPGFVYDESASGKTIFIEPAAIVELNNEVRELYFAQQREIYKILSDFSDFLRPYVNELIDAAAFIGEIDFLRAKALVAISMEAGKPILSTEGELKLIRGRHPILEAALKREKKEIVPLTLTLNRDKHILVISGPNAGGKSVCLKTVGLLQYMFQWGLLVPASEISEFPVFNNIFIDIGDEQSLENDLSTYSSHLSNMKVLLTCADDRSLALIDEFGSGTEPAAGGAIAETILAHMEQMGVYGVITTHYTNLKLYAGNSKGVMNGAMLFDSAKIAPLYKLEAGLPGNSFAFELARKMGLPETIVKEAEERAGESFVDMEKQLRKISRNRRQLDEKLMRIKNTDKMLESVTEKYKRELEEIQQAKRQIIEEAKQEAAAIVKEANRKIEATIKQIKESQAEKEQTKIIRKELEDFREKLKREEESENDKKIAAKMEKLIQRQKRREEKKNERRAETESAPKPEDDGKISVGDKVMVKESGIVGEVMQINGKILNISVGNIVSKTEIGKVKKISNREFKNITGEELRQTSYSTDNLSQRRLEFKPTIDIRGERLVQAMEIVSRFIDDALMVGIGQVKILHGKGNGILKEEIRKYLKTVPGVSSYRDEDIQLGGSGITVVDFE